MRGFAVAAFFRTLIQLLNEKKTLDQPERDHRKATPNKGKGSLYDPRLRELLDCPTLTRSAIECFHNNDDEAFGLKDIFGTSATTGKSAHVVVLEFYRNQ